MWPESSWQPSEVSGQSPATGAKRWDNITASTKDSSLAQDSPSGSWSDGAKCTRHSLAFTEKMLQISHFSG